MGKYFQRSQDVSEKNLNRGWELMMADMSAMVSEANEYRELIIHRQNVRAKNFRESGGESAFTPEELETHALEDARLERQLNRLNIVTAEVGNRALMMRLSWNLDNGGG